MELYRAARQWQTRPDDERFWDLTEMFDACRQHVESAVVSHVRSKEMHFISKGDDVVLFGGAGLEAVLTHYSFGQLARLGGAPADYLRSLSPELAAMNLEHGFTKGNEERSLSLLFHQNGGLVLRAATSEMYERVWDAEIVLGLRSLEEAGWRVPPGRAVPGSRSRPATDRDVLQNASHASLGVRAGEMVSPAGLYASDHDMFAFLVDDSKRIDVGDTSLCRGFFAWNSEVGDKSLGIQTFLFDAVCGNHVVWNARDVNEIRIRHIGERAKRWEKEVTLELVRYANMSTSDDEARIESARSCVLAATKDEVIERLFGIKSLALSRKTITAAYEVAEMSPRYGDPRSAWAIANGLTEVSQTTSYADERVRLDRAAGKVLTITF